MRRRIKAAAPLALGTGLVALDVVMMANGPSPPRFSTGGTCGNVLLALRYLGFEAAPACRLQDDPAGRLIIEELRAWGVSTDHVSAGVDGATPVIVQTLRTPPGQPPTHTFSWRCPSCGSRFPGYKPVLASEAEAIAAGMRAPSVYFFDRTSRGAIILAARAAELGALVMFEPSAVGDPALFREAWDVSHAVKYSHERLAELPEGFELGPRQLLQIETLGAAGLRYRARAGGKAASPWKHLDALKAPALVDTAGAGDWCTAGILHGLGRSGADGLRRASRAEVGAGVRFGQALAAWSCGYVGARGGMSQVPVRECLAEVARILEGRGGAPARSRALRGDAGGERSLCSACSEGPVPVAVPAWKRTTA